MNFEKIKSERDFVKQLGLIKPRKIFSVYIQNKVYDVYNIEGKEHLGLNNIPNTWWLYFTSRILNECPKIDSEHFIPFDIGIKRHLWEFEIKQTNTYKIKWNDDSFSNNISVTMICNKKKIYSFGTFDMNFALSKIQYLQVVLSEHPYNFFEPEKEKGRKIYHYGLPATVEPSYYPGEIKIIPEYSDELPEREWWNELERREKPFIQKKKLSGDEKWDEIFNKEQRQETREYGSINWGDALRDGHINWFRK